MSNALVSVFFGEETFLVEEAGQEYISTYSDFQWSVLEGDFEVQTFLSLTQSTGLFSSKTGIHLKNPWFFTKAPTDKEAKQLVTFFQQHAHPDVRILITHKGKLDQRKKMVTTLKKCAFMKDFQPFKDWEQQKICQWIQQRIQKKGASITQEALIAFQQCCGQSLQEAACEIETLLTYLGDRRDIIIDDIQAISTDQQSTAYDLTEALKKRSFNRISETLSILLSMGEEPIRLLGLLVATFRTYLQLLSFEGQRLSSQDIAKKLGKNPYFIKLLLQDVQKKYSFQDVKTIYAALAQTDYEIKKGLIKPNVALELLPQVIAPQD